MPSCGGDISCPLQSRVYLGFRCMFGVIYCVVSCVSDGETWHCIGHFIISNVISRSPLLPLPAQHKRRLAPEREKYNTATWPYSPSSPLSHYLLSLSLSLSFFNLLSFTSWPRREKCFQSPLSFDVPVSRLLFFFFFHFLSISPLCVMIFPLFLKIEEALWC